ncbi:ribose-phosphate pyrophosphokinase [Phenylobacterium soli]|uniref:Ribose-phosphate diphosphokinase n=1 Tax=Phenylobacterium soli TaxID=2170551 RepID=A0A328AH80_9CAUL|nr:ribose-phosphate pyrophosphokinase [Phenylobacterium soli]RAK54100.1 ribose-phosphate diphosphokinase [Phenylobacterium soli]
MTAGPFVFALPGSERQGRDLADRLGAETGVLETRRFPDGESYVRIVSVVAGRDVALVCSLARPDDQFLRLVFAARTLRELGASRITLVAPYLAYMRQDKQFHSGEAVTSTYFADLLSREVDRVITVDPHLHRHKALAEIYAVPAVALHAAPLLADWIAANVAQPLVIGPDLESEQWVADVAGRSEAPYVVLRKARRGDRNVEIATPDLSQWAGRQPVLIDDIASSGRTLIEAARGLAAQGFRPPVCVVVHALFADDAYAELSGVAERIVSTDAVTHPSNGIPLAGLLADAVRT